ncbi:MAG: KamA family radical SAM protein [bacterium]
MSRSALKERRGFRKASEGDAKRLAAQLESRFPGFRPGRAFREVIKRYPAQAPGELLQLIAKPSFNDPVFRQVVPSLEELDEGGDEDPAGETKFAAVPGVLHRYTDRALLITTNNCLVRCRHCMRKRLWSDGDETDTDRLPAWINYLADHPEIKEVILSGGDPLALPDERLLQILAALHGLPGKKKLRVHSRALMACPSRITAGLARAMSGFGVKRFVTQMNHPVEVTKRAREAARVLGNSGIKTENQAVLLKGVNDSPEVLAELFYKTAAAGILPYYLHHPDRARGCLHFYMELPQGAETYRKAKELNGGIAPDYVVDLPGRDAKKEVLGLLG